MKRGGNELKDSAINPLLVVLSGPSGVGKDAVLSGMKKKERSLHYAVTATTRPRRQGERDGYEYHFVPKSDFERMIKDDELLEWANVYGNLYGVPKKEVRQALARGRDIMVKVDVQGAANIKRVAPQAVFIFLAPPSLEELQERLKQRKTESGVDLELRMKAARKEMDSLSMFDYVVVNHKGGVAQAISHIEAIIAAEKCRVKPRRVELA
jgi:guanylate kinase